jgi:hypothetical protein
MSTRRSRWPSHFDLKTLNRGESVAGGSGRSAGCLRGGSVLRGSPLTEAGHKLVLEVARDADAVAELGRAIDAMDFLQGSAGQAAVAIDVPAPAAAARRRLQRP